VLYAAFDFLGTETDREVGREEADYIEGLYIINMRESKYL
jgi:hypothetical protein